MLTLAPAGFVQTPDEAGLAICIRAGETHAAGRDAAALPDLRTCFENEAMTQYNRALAYTLYVRTLEKLGRIDETITELRKITAAPWASMDGFDRPTLAMDVVRSREIFVGASQPELIFDLASLLQQQGKIDEALVEVQRGLTAARTVRADALGEEAHGWMAYAILMQAKQDAAGMGAGMVRAYVRGYDHEALENYVAQQTPELQERLKQMRATMREQRPRFAYRDAWAASLGKRLDLQEDPAAAEALSKFAEVEAQESALVGPIPFE
jgi:tetratricopeptide (TPR) repeat protein